MPRVLLALLVVAGLAAGVAWFVGRGDAARGGGPSPEATAERDSPPPPGELAPEPALAARASEPVRAPARVEAPAAREAVGEATEETPAGELARAQWLEGRLVFPPGTPTDEQAVVRANGVGRWEHHAPVAADGSFRVAFGERAESGRLELQARYLYLPEVVRWRKAEAGATLVLEPRLGARVEGHLRAPHGAELAPEDGKVVLSATRADSVMLRNHLDEAGLSPALEFRFEAVRLDATGREHELEYVGSRLLGHSPALALEPGRTLTLELALRPGVTLAGVVRDEQGAPLADVHVEARVRSATAWSESNQRSAQTAADGSFRLGALAPGKIVLEAEHEGFVALERELGALAEATSLAELELVLARGHSIAGRVLWPDGSPAVADVELAPLLEKTEREARARALSTRSDVQGAFSVAGLAARSYRLTAQAMRSEASGARLAWNAEQEPVAAGTRELVLTLRPALELAGRASDEHGAPLSEFEVSARRLERDALIGFRAEQNRSFHEADGRFRLTGLAPGEWELTATGPAHASASPVRVTLPTDELVILVLPRGARLQGRVLDPGGAPVRAAELDLARAGPLQLDFSPEKNARTDSDGRFELERLAAGPLTLTARAAGFAPSVPLELELAPGDDVLELVLRLRPGARVVGEFVGSDGRPQPGRLVFAYGAGHMARAETDANGHFELTGLPPGELQLNGETSDGIAVRKLLTLGEGASVSVRLEAPAGLVRLHGTVRAGGEPLAGARLYASSGEDGGKADGSSSTGETDAQGAYELTLPGPGVHWLAIHGAAESGISWRVRVDAPVVAELALDVTIPLGRISGRVTDEQGAPLAGIFVVSQPEQHEGGAHGSAHATSAADGSFELLVPAGQHALQAGGALQKPDRSAPALAEARVVGLRVTENGHLRGVELVLQAGGTLAGNVRNADGSGADQAVLWLEDGARGRVVGRSDAHGRFELPGLAAQRHRVGARSRTGATSELAEVEIRAGETTRLELTLVPATRVHLSVRQGGRPVGSEIEAFDERGARQAVQTGENGEAWLGPLVPGRYTVRAQRDGQRAERTFEVAGGVEELELSLVFE